MESILLNKSEREALNAIKSDTASIKEDTTSLKTEVGAVKTNLTTANTNITTAKNNTETIKSDTASIKSTITDVMVPILKRIDDTRKRYGFRIKKSEADPTERVEYIYDAVGKTPAGLTADKVFNYGSWGDVWFIKDNYPCMVKTNGKEDYKLDPNDYSKKAKTGDAKTVSGATISDFCNPSYDGNAMSAIPLCWVQRYEEDGYEYFVVCQTQYDDSYKAYAHTRADGTIANYFYHAMFKGSVSGTTDADYKLRSLGGQVTQWYQNDYGAGSGGASKELQYIARTGSIYSMRSWSQHCLIADLCTLISKTENSQTVFGAGRTIGFVDNDNTNNFYGHIKTSGEADDTESLYKAGQFSGYKQANGNGSHHVKVFHIEDFWGERWDRILGLTQKNGVIYAKMTPEGNGYNLAGQGYEPLPITIPFTDKNNQGWWKNTYMSEYGRLPQGEVTGSNSTYVTDYFWINHYGNIVTVALFGGCCNSGSMCGSRYLNLNNSASNAKWNIGASFIIH